MTATPRLNEKQLLHAKALFDGLEKKIQKLSKSNLKLVFAYRRKLRKLLEYKERGTPALRTKLKKEMWGFQRGKCAICGKRIPLKESELDRLHRVPLNPYVKKNVQVLCHKCHRADQKRNRFA